MPAATIRTPIWTNCHVLPVEGLITEDAMATILAREEKCSRAVAATVNKISVDHKGLLDEVSKPSDDM